MLPSPFRSETTGFLVHGPTFFRRSSRLDTLTLLSQKISQVQRLALFADVSASDCASIISAGREKRFSRIVVSGAARVTHTPLRI